jgi:hypothetical protein
MLRFIRKAVRFIRKAVSILTNNFIIGLVFVIDGVFFAHGSIRGVLVAFGLFFVIQGQIDMILDHLTEVSKR